MAGGQQIDSATGTLGDARTVPLRSRKTGTGAATFQLTGIASAVQQGLLAQATRLTGVGLSSFQGALTAVVPISWLAPIAPSFQAGSTTPYSLAALVSNYNAGTDTFAWETGYTPPSWLSIDFANLQPSGAQGDSDDISSSPGLKIRVTRSTGGTALSNAFGVTVYVAGSGVATWSDLLPMMWNANMAESSSQFKQQILGGLANNYAEWQAIEAQASDPVTWTMLATPLWAGFYPIAVDEEKHYITIIPG